MEKYKTYSNGDILRLDEFPKAVFIICCDCGLSHLHYFEKDKKGVFFRTYRDDYLTKQHRKKK